MLGTVRLRRGAVCPVGPSAHQTIFVTEAASGPKKSEPAGFVADGQFQPKCLGSELSRQIAVDLESDADLDEGRGCPGHWAFPSVFMNAARYIGSRSESNLRGAQFACDRTTLPRMSIGAATSSSIVAALTSLPQRALCPRKVASVEVRPRRSIAPVLKKVFV